MTTRAAAVFGSPYRGDDAVGQLVGDELRERGVEVIDCHDEPTRLLHRLPDLEVVVLVDAVISGAAPGTLHRLDVVQGRLPGSVRLASTHALGVGDVLALAEVLGRSAARTVLIGVEGRRFAMGAPLTPAVEAAIGGAVAEVLSAIR